MIGVRQCGAGRSRTTCGWTVTGWSNRYVVRCSRATRIVMAGSRRACAGGSDRRAARTPSYGRAAGWSQGTGTASGGRRPPPEDRRAGPAAQETPRWRPGTARTAARRWRHDELQGLHRHLDPAAAASDAPRRRDSRPGARRRRRAVAHRAAVDGPAVRGVRRPDGGRGRGRGAGGPRVPAGRRRPRRHAPRRRRVRGPASAACRRRRPPGALPHRAGRRRGPGRRDHARAATTT